MQESVPTRQRNDRSGQDPAAAPRAIGKIDLPKQCRPAHVLNTCLDLGFCAVLADLEEGRIR